MRITSCWLKGSSGRRIKQEKQQQSRRDFDKSSCTNFTSVTSTSGSESPGILQSQIQVNKWIISTEEKSASTKNIDNRKEKKKEKIKQNFPWKANADKALVTRKVHEILTSYHYRTVGQLS